MKSEQIQSILDGWREEYNVTQPVEFVGWEDMDEGATTVLGKCRYRTDRCEIRLGDRFEDRPLGWLETSVLWHEFCHANAYLEDGESDAHNKYFVDYQKRKKKYFWGDILAKFVYVFL